MGIKIFFITGQSIEELTNDFLDINEIHLGLSGKLINICSFIQNLHQHMNKNVCVHKI